MTVFSTICLNRFGTCVLIHWLLCACRFTFILYLLEIFVVDWVVGAGLTSNWHFCAAASCSASSCTASSSAQCGARDRDCSSTNSPRCKARAGLCRRQAAHCSRFCKKSKSWEVLSGRGSSTASVAIETNSSLSPAGYGRFIKHVHSLC